MSLPSGYKRLEYIQSTGKQYIDTGFKPNQDTRLEMVATPMSIDDAAQGVGFIPYGSGVSYNSNAFECYTVTNKLEFNYDGQYDFIWAAAIGTTITIDHNKNNVSIKQDSQVVASKVFNYKSFSVPYNLTLFGINRGSIMCGLLKLYSCQIYDNGTLIRDYIPCQTTAGEIGLWDDVNSVFYGNAGTGTFTAGTVLAIAADASEITELEYIQSSGTQYVNTGITINATTYKRYRFLFDIGYPSIGGSYWLVNGNSGSNVIYYFGLSNTGKIVYGNGTTDVSGSVTATTGRYLVDFNPSDGSYKFGSLQNLTGLTFNAPSGSQNFYLFAYNKGNGQDMHTERLYSAKIYDNGTLIRDYIAAKLSDGTVGLYDKLNGLLYINAGTGTFTAGPVVASPSIFVNIDGIWKPINHIYVNINNIWQKST